MKLHFIVFLAILSTICTTTASQMTDDNFQIAVSNSGSNFIEFLNQGIAAGCNAFKDIYLTTTDLTNMIDNFANNIVAKVNEIKAALSSQLSQILALLCGPLNYLFGGTTIKSVFDLFDGFGNDAVKFLYSLVGQTDESIHYAFCGKDNPGTVWNYFINLYTIFSGKVTALSQLLSNLCVV